MGAEAVPIKEDIDQDISDLELKIIRQMEYYFGNFNLCKDKFLREQIKLDDGWVPLETMIKFNRLKSLSTDFGVISEALKKSPNNLLEVDEDSTKVRRRVENPIPDESYTSQDAMDDRTLYVKGFKRTHTLDLLLDFFKPHKAESIYMRRRYKAKDKPFKGSCFVMFETKEDADTFLETKGIKYENMELLKERKVDYQKRKDIFYENLRAEKEKKLEKKSEENEEAVKDVKVDIPGCLIKVCGLSKDCLREDLTEAFNAFGTVVFTDYFRGNPEAVIRYDSGIAASVVEKAEEEDGEKKLLIGSTKATISLVDGDSEKEYWKNIALKKLNARQRHSTYQKQNSKGRFGKYNRGKRQRGGNRRNDEPTEPEESSEQPPSKKVKVEDVGETQESTVKESPPEKEPSMESTKSNGSTNETAMEIKTEC